jgi:hypothetical protein
LEWYFVLINSAKIVLMVIQRKLLLANSPCSC